MKMPTNGVAKDIRHYVGALIVFFLVIIILFYLTRISNTKRKLSDSKHLNRYDSGKYCYGNKFYYW